MALNELRSARYDATLDLGADLRQDAGPLDSREFGDMQNELMDMLSRVQAGDLAALPQDGLAAFQGVLTGFLAGGIGYSNAVVMDQRFFQMRGQRLPKRGQLGV